MFNIRYLKEEENEFLKKMLYESIFIEKEKKPPMEVLLNADELKKYHQHWGRNGDKAFIAIDHHRTPVGAAWFRLYTNEEKSYGFMDDQTPELGIAIEETVRNKGLGTQLMKAIIEEAKKDEFKTLSLSVDKKNEHAYQLYLKQGFEVVRSDETSYTMLLQL